MKLMVVLLQEQGMAPNDQGGTLHNNNLESADNVANTSHNIKCLLVPTYTTPSQNEELPHSLLPNHTPK